MRLACHLIIKYVDTPKLKVKRNFSSPVASTGRGKWEWGKKKRKKGPSRTAFSNHLTLPKPNPTGLEKGKKSLIFALSFFSFVWFCKRYYLPSVPLNADDLSVPCALLTSVSPPSDYRLVTTRLVCTACPAYLDFSVCTHHYLQLARCFTQPGLSDEVFCIELHVRRHTAQEAG